jgi:F-type H+-transporting ATPase subunit b
MDEILTQLAGLFVRAIPTAVLLVLLWGLYKVIVHNRLVAVLGERRARTEGAMEKARADIAGAEARAAEYEQRIREAKLAVYKSLEARRRQLLEARATTLAEARAAAEARVRAAREVLASDVAQAKVSLQAEAENLAAAIIRTILKPARGVPSPAAGGLR